MQPSLRSGFFILFRLLARVLRPRTRRRPKMKNPAVAGLHHPFQVGGERGIRTPGGVTLNSFQDCRNRPLCHLSAAKVIQASAFLQDPVFFEPALCSVLYFNRYCRGETTWVVYSLS